MLVGEPVPPRPFCTQPRSCRHAHSMSWLCPYLCSTLFANTKPIFKTNFINYVTTCTKTCMTSTLIISDWRVKSRMVLQVAQLPFKPSGAVYWCFWELTTWCTRQSGVHHAKRPSENTVILMQKHAKNPWKLCYIQYLLSPSAKTSSNFFWGSPGNKILSFSNISLLQTCTQFGQPEIWINVKI